MRLEDVLLRGLRPSGSTAAADAQESHGCHPRGMRSPVRPYAVVRKYFSCPARSTKVTTLDARAM